MEAEGGLLDKIRPPRLEDAGLEDCALPPDAIHEAFLKAFAAASILSVPDDDGDLESITDSLPDGVHPPPEAGGPRDKEKGGVPPRFDGEDVVVAGVPGGSNAAEVVVGAGDLPEAGKGCVEGRVRSEIDKVRKNEDDGTDGECKRPSSVEACV